MTQLSFLGDMLTTLFERRAPTAPAGDTRSLDDMCLALLDAGGEVSGIALAQSILDRYAALTPAEKRTFFTFLNDVLEISPQGVQAAAQTFAASQSVADYRALAQAAEPRRQELLRRLNQPPGATRALVNMRTDLLAALAEDPNLARTDLDFRHLLRSWFNRGFLVLRQISWETPASILEKIVEYEAVHAIQDWDDLRRRLYPQDRRCFAYFHPTMPDEPLIFVEVALTMSVPASIQHVLAGDREVRSPQDTSVAVFYSISNCQTGLKGISFGNLLIKQVVDELRQELPGLDTFVTLSPIPRFNAWLSQQTEDETARTILQGHGSADMIRQAASDYLAHARTAQGAPFDPVARFHLGNGAQIYAVHADADLSENGQHQSSGAMVNYHYDLDLLEQNHERFVQNGDVSMTPAFRSTLTAGPETT
ncbi:malonyl-CoA decarboxylase [uncultured Tateyamaria sp.]|uniref:malonyl-CoA decarboxylase n=1 Tax=uncultured Tateyamaria sp. TaxID=455651 RepID=UPI00260270DE|nr:malonyl-CoA decarboxylase [uncultured Tateyamaria sp.]